MFNDIKKYYRIPLYRNSIAILLNTGSMAFFGLIFWVVAARTMSSSDVGLATAAISATTLIASLSRLGMDASIIRFFPDAQDRGSLYNTIQLITLVASAILTVIFLMGISLFSPSLQFLREGWYPIEFIIFTILFSITFMQNTGLIALRHGDLSFIQNFILGARIPIIIIIPSIAAMSVLSSYGIAYVLTFIFGAYALYKLDIPLKISFNINIVKETLHYSLGNFTSSVLMIAPTTIIPIMVVNMIGARNGAYFFIAYSIASILVLVPYAVSMSLFVEGSHGEPLRRSIINSIKFTVLLLVPLLAIIILFGGQLLLIFNSEYSTESLMLLRLLAISSLFSAISWIYISIKKIEKDLKMINYISLASALMLITLGYILMSIFGLIGIGYAWLASNVIISIVVCWLMIRVEKWF